MKHFKLTFIFCMSAASLLAAPPTNYYSSLDGKTGSNIKSALTSIISSHTNVGYDGLYEVYEKADMREDGVTLWDMYSDCEFTIKDTKGSNANVCGCYNREHSLPKSWWGSGKAAQYSDAYHVIPTDCRVNGQRSNYAFGECEGGTRLTAKARGKLGTSTFSGYSGTVFEPDDEYKGDFARHYFYMLTAYPKVDFSDGNGGAMFSQAGELTSYGLALLLKWHRMDPVSTKELNRNDAVSGFQKNRNPFIDYPCLVEYIWGNKKGETLNINAIMCAYSAEYAASDQTGCYNQPTSPTILNPQNNATINIGSASLNKTISKNITIEAALLTSPVTLSLSGANADLFKLSTNTIPAETANKTTEIAISYSPTALGNHSAKLTLTSPNANTVNITLTGSCIASLTSPSTDIYITNNNVGTPMPFIIRVAGTNLSDNITLTLSGTYADMFNLSHTTITAAQAQEGFNVNATYTPTALGTHAVTLTVSSKDFGTKTISIKGNSVFTVLPVTYITYHSAQLNWTNAGVTNYTINVFQKSVVGTDEVLIMTDDCKATKGTKSGYTAIENDALRLGSGSSMGTLTFNNLDLSAGGRIEFEAKYYNKDDCPVEVKLGSTTLATQQLSNEFAIYSIEVPANDDYKDVALTFSTIEKSKRVILKTVNVYTGGEQINDVSIDGYPREVSNLQSFVVENLDSLTEYWVTIQPEGQKVSDEVMFITDNSNTAALSSFIYEGITYALNADGVELSRLPIGSDIQVYNALGQLIMHRRNSLNTELISLPQGFFLIKIGKQTIRIVH